MRNLENIIDDYLSKPTDFAVQIVGSWGHGKTYYYRNTLEQLIYDKPIHNDATKKYKPIYVSLFGLKSIEDIATKIVLDFYQSKLFKNYVRKTAIKKRLKITQSVLKIGLRGFLNFQRLGNTNDYLTDIKSIGENVLDADELVICFDDLERKDTSLNIEDLTGYINSLVDEGIKVLLISNEDLLLKGGGEYKNLKEKIIGITVEFIPNTNEILENIIKIRYSSYPTYAHYLAEIIEELTKLSKATGDNFRHIIYALDSLHHCYSKIRKDIIDNKSDIAEKVIEELKNISIFIFIVAIEYKSSTLKYSDLDDYKDDAFFPYELIKGNSTDNDNRKEEDKSKLEILLEKYNIPKEQYHFYKSIFIYVTGFDEFDIDSFKSEFTEKFNLEKGKVLPQYEILNALGYQNCFTLSDDEYKQKTVAAIEYAFSGQYAPVDYLSVMHFAERLDNLFDFDLTEVKNKLFIGLEKVIQNTPLNNVAYSQFEMSGKMSTISKIVRQLYDEGIKTFKQFEERKVKEKIEAIGDLLITDIQEFQNRYQADNDFRFHLSYYPFLNYLETETLIEKIKKTNSQGIVFLRHFLKQ